LRLERLSNQGHSGVEVGSVKIRAVEVGAVVNGCFLLVVGC
jgi:hypothetical protein